MGDMSKHDIHEAAGRPLRRARTSAWIVTVAMGGTTMAFQVYHSVKFGHMPWELAALYGVVPLLIAVLVLEIVAEWRRAPWPATAGAYLIMGAAMFLSASATGAVVLHAAPAHWSLLFGALLDGAELLAAYFIMNGPLAAQAVAEVVQREAELRAAADAELRARQEDARAHDRALADARGAHAEEVRALGEKLDAERAARENAQAEAAAHAAAENERDIAHAELEGARSGLQAAQDARADAEVRAQRAEAERDRLARKLGAQKGTPRARRAGTEQASGSVPKDVDARAEALALYLSEPDISGAQLGPAVGMSKRWGQDRMKEFKTTVAGGSENTDS